MSRASYDKVPFPVFAALLVSQMEALGLTGRALAKRLGVREQTVSEWRRGSYRPEADRLRELSVIIGVSQETLRSDDHGGRVSESPAAPYLADSAAFLAGRAFELESLMSYVMSRQKELGVSLNAKAIAEGVVQSVRRSAEGPDQAKEA